MFIVHCMYLSCSINQYFSFFVENCALCTFGSVVLIDICGRVVAVSVLKRFVAGDAVPQTSY